MPRCGVPVRQDGTNVVNQAFLRRPAIAGLRPATRTAQRAVPALIVCERHHQLVPMSTETAIGRRWLVRKPGACFKIHLKLRSSERQ